jgi:GTP cyclohydrolase II
VYKQITSDDIHIALQWGDWTEEEEVPVRVFSENNAHELAAFIFLAGINN